MTSICKDFSPSICIPDLYCLVRATRGNILPLRRPCQGIYTFISMTRIGQIVASSFSVPHLHSVIFIARGDTLPIGRPRHGMRIFASGMAGIGQNELVREDVPDLYCTIFTTCNNLLALGQPSQRPYITRKPPTNEDTVYTDS